MTLNNCMNRHNMQQLAVADDSVEGDSRSSDKTYVYMMYFF